MSDLPTYPQEAADREAAQPAELELEYSSWFRRVVAYLLDTVVLIAPIAVLLTIVFVANPSDNSAAWIVLVVAYLVTLLLPFVYFTVLHGRTPGQTVGKRAFGIRVVDAQTGGPIGYGRAFGRYAITVLFGFIILPLLLDYLWPLWDRRNQALHDKVVGSVVVRS